MVIVERANIVIPNQKRVLCECDHLQVLGHNTQRLLEPVLEFLR